MFTTMASKEEGYIPNNMRAKHNKQKKIPLICKYYAHDITCPFMATQKTCRHTHCPIVKEAATFAKEQRSKNNFVNG